MEVGCVALAKKRPRWIHGFSQVSVVGFFFDCSPFNRSYYPCLGQEPSSAYYILTNLHPFHASKLDSRTLDVAMSLERSGSTIEHNVTRRCEWRVYRSSGLRPWSHDASLSLPTQQTIPTLLPMLPPYCVVML